MADLERVLRSGHLFARTFNPRVDPAVLDCLDEQAGDARP